MKRLVINIFTLASLIFLLLFFSGFIRSAYSGNLINNVIVRSHSMLAASTLSEKQSGSLAQKNISHVNGEKNSTDNNTIEVLRKQGGVSTYAQPGVLSILASNSSSNNIQEKQVTLERLIIRTTNLRIVANNVNQLMQQINQLANRFHGYVGNSQLVQANLNNRDTTASISIRVPAKEMEEIIIQLKSLASKVEQEDTSGEDITDKYVDLGSKIKNLQVSKAQLTLIMARAKNPEDVLNIQNQLSNTQRQLDDLEGAKNYFDQSVNYSLINIQLNTIPNPIITSPTKHWQITKVIKSSYYNLVIQMEYMSDAVISFIIYYIPLIFLWVLLSGLVFIMGRTIYYRFIGIHPSVFTNIKNNTIFIGIGCAIVIIILFFIYHNSVNNKLYAPSPLLTPVPNNINYPLNSSLNLSPLTGNWEHEGNKTLINMVGNKLIFCNEQNDCVEGYLSNNNIIEVPQWNVTGTINSNKTVISWGNNTLWRRN